MQDKIDKRKQLMRMFKDKYYLLLSAAIIFNKIIKKIEGTYRFK